MFIRAAFERRETDADTSAPIRFVASTEGVKADGLDLRFEDWALDRWVRHPIVLFGHDYSGMRALPIGTGRAEFQGRDLMIDVAFDTEDEFAMRVRGKTVRGMMGGSVSWDTVTRDGKRKNELLEFSVVPIPLDPNALPVRQMRGLYDLAHNFMDALEHAGEGTDPREADLFGGLAQAMRALYGESGLALGDDKRRKLFNWLERCYHALDRTAPEWKDETELRAFDEATRHGLFFENEFGMNGERAGAVLNARNKEKLQQAQALIGEVVASAEPPDEAGKKKKPNDDDMNADDVARAETSAELYAQTMLARVRLMQ